MRCRNFGIWIHIFFIILFGIRLNAQSYFELGIYNELTSQTGSKVVNPGDLVTFYIIAVTDQPVAALIYQVALPGAGWKLNSRNYQSHGWVKQNPGDPLNEDNSKPFQGEDPKLITDTLIGPGGSAFDFKFESAPPDKQEKTGNFVIEEINLTVPNNITCGTYQIELTNVDAFDKGVPILIPIGNITPVLHAMIIDVPASLAEKTVPPVLVGVPSDVTLQCDAIPAAATVTATDNCGSAVAVTMNQVPESLDGNFCSGTIIRTWTATDDFGNTTTASQTITVRDNTPPSLLGVPVDVTVECNAIPEVTTVTATDNCDTEVLVTITQQPESFEAGVCPEMVIRTWTAMDNCGNSSVAVQTITVLSPVTISWQQELVISSALPGTISFGMVAEDADSLDVTLSGPPYDPGVVYLSDGETLYRNDFTNDVATFEWLLVAHAGSSELGISWNTPQLPPDKLLTMVAVDQHLRPIGEPTIAMQGSNSLMVPANIVKQYRILYGSYTAVVLSLRRGWNLISLPIIPLDGDIDEILVDPITRLRVYQGVVTRFVNGQIQVAATIEALRGYWLYLTTPNHLLIKGTPLQTVNKTINVSAGWHLYGPAEVIPIPANLPIIRAWDGKRYIIPQSPLHPTNAYYFHTSGSSTPVNLGK